MSGGATGLLQIAGLRITTADGTELLRGIDLEVAAGERFGLVGESGSGKSLTALAVLGLLPAGLTASGSVRLDGVEIVGPSGVADERTLRAIRGAVAAPVFQEPLTALDPLMRVGRQVAEPLGRHRGLRGAALHRGVLDALTEVALPDPARLARARPYELSGGQRQRVAIAMALACRPKLLIADEPTTALDVTVQAGILDLLDRATRERDMAVLFISHDLPVVARAADRMLVLEHGAAVETGRVVDIVAAPAEAYTRRLVGSALTLEGALDDLRSDDR